MSDYTPTGAPADQTRGASATIRSEFQAVATAIATKADTAGETYTGAHDFSGSSGVTLPAATAIGSVSATELAYLDGVTSAIQTQLGTKSAKAGETYSGTHDFSGATSVAVPAPSSGAHAVTKTFVEALAFSAALPLQAGNAGKFVTTDGTSASWATLSTGASLSGATTLDLTSGNATLTSASDQVQTITAAVSGRAINLPDSTSMTEGGFPFVISNKTGHSVMLKNNPGGIVRVIYPSTVVLVALTDAATNTWGAYQFYDGIETGLPSVFESAATYYTSVAMLDSSKAVVTYRDGDNSGYGTACVLSISGTTVTAGTPVVFESAATDYISVAMLDSSKAVVTYADSGNSSYGTACVLSISGTTVTAGTPVVFESAITDYISVAMLDSSKVVVTYRDSGNSNYGTACVLSISGTTVTAGTPVVFESANTTYMSVAMLDSSKAVVTYRDGGNSNYGTACVLSISGTTVTAGTPVVFESATTSYTSVAMLGSSKAVVTYQDGGNSSYGTACVLSISGTTVTAGTPVVFESATTDYISVAMLDSSKAVVTYRDGDNSNYGTACVLSISGTTVTAGTPVVFESATTDYTSVAMLDSSKVVVTYRDSDNSYYGTACVLLNL